MANAEFDGRVDLPERLGERDQAVARRSQKPEWLTGIRSCARDGDGVFNAHPGQGSLRSQSLKTMSGLNRLSWSAWW